MSRAISRPILSRSGWFMAHSGGAMEAAQLIALPIEFSPGQSRSLEFSAQIGIFMPPGVPGGCFIFFLNYLESEESDKYWPRNSLIRPGFNSGGRNFEGTKFGLIVDVLGTIEKPRSTAFKRPTNHINPLTIDPNRPFRADKPWQELHAASKVYKVALGACAERLALKDAVRGLRSNRQEHERLKGGCKEVCGLEDVSASQCFVQKSEE
ncbi:hypothetical protein C8R45DRAFT_933045 [Mycena sanguinolenta]|nr:hypothetical protein C8R45DRAFT_933045 [Mycena sanguinolenta]